MHRRSLVSHFKRVTIALLLGLALNWVVVWGLGEIPRRLDIGHYRRVQIIWNADDGVRRNLHITEYRWAGVLERQYHTQRRSLTNVQPSAFSVWWAWSPLIAEPSAQDAFAGLTAELTGDDIDPETSTYSVVEYGFPAVSARAVGAVNDAVFLPDGSFARRVRGAFSTPVINTAPATKPEAWPLAYHIWLPYRPVWTGMAINTVFYALLAWIALSVLRAFRHARRMGRGRCPVCAYDLGFDLRPGCPECGWRKGAD